MTAPSEDFAKTPDAVGVARANYDRVMVQVEHEKMRGIHREDGIYATRANERWAEVVAAVESRVRAECAAKVRALPSVRYTDVLGNYINTVIDRDEALAALEAE